MPIRVKWVGGFCPLTHLTPGDENVFQITLTMHSQQLWLRVSPVWARNETIFRWAFADGYSGRSWVRWDSGL